MARSFSVFQINQSGGPGVPGTISVPTNLISSFQGKFFREDIAPHASLPAHTDPAPLGYTLVLATTFVIEDNESYAGRYTVYTPVDAPDAVTNPSSSFDGLNTIIRVNEIIGAPISPGDTSTGTVTNISTYVITIAGPEADILIPPAVFIENRSIELVGRFGSPWGEVYSQNFIDLAQNFAASVAPANPFLGQMWYDFPNNELNLQTTGGWVQIASTAPGVGTTYRHNFSASAGVPLNVNHGLNLIGPEFVAITQVFVDVSGDYKMIIPQDITYIDANNLSITFTNAQTGVILMRV